MRNGVFTCLKNLLCILGFFSKFKAVYPPESRESSWSGKQNINQEIRATTEKGLKTIILVLHSADILRSSGQAAKGWCGMLRHP
jgi:hypothetical protein